MNTQPAEQRHQLLPVPWGPLSGWAQNIWETDVLHLRAPFPPRDYCAMGTCHEHSGYTAQARHQPLHAIGDQWYSEKPDIHGAVCKSQLW